MDLGRHPGEWLRRDQQCYVKCERWIRGFGGTAGLELLRVHDHPYAALDSRLCTERVANITQIAESTIGEFVVALGSNQPAPGGGAVAGVALALSGAMVKMACGYSIGKKKYAEVESELVAIVDRCEAISERALALADADAVAYAGFAAAMNLPRKSPEEKTARRAALAEAARSATAIPLELAELCAELIELADKTCRIGNPNLVGDAAGCGSLARGALRICQLNVGSNVAVIDDNDFVERTRTRMDAAAGALERSDGTVDRYL